MSALFHRLLDEIAVTEDPPPTRRFDWAITAVLAILAVAELVVFGATPGWMAAELAVIAAAVAVLPYRRRNPLLATLVAFVAQTVLAISASSADVELAATFGHGAAGVMLVYAVCRWLIPKLVAVGLVGIFVLTLVTDRIIGFAITDSLVDLVAWAIVVVFALSMRYRARLIEQRGAEIRLAERNTLARELHDTIAHHVSAIAVQAQAAQFVAVSNPEAAAAAMGNVETIANTAIDEMRSMVGILRSDDDRARTVAATSLDDFVADDERPTVNLIGDSSLAELPASVASAVYRIAQEAITNARRHSRNVSFIDVECIRSPSDVRLEVVNDGVPTTRNAGGGYGLIGMQERVAALGGEVQSGPRQPEGWSVTATIPLAGPG